ncbi:MAG: hypothetical protein IPK63_16460 [Candidatus Competibacteraceae bacterium]|nr:hypothetical protein [Candidatus Competibacteraceae bacterium]
MAAQFEGAVRPRRSRCGRRLIQQLDKAQLVVRPLLYLNHRFMRRRWECAVAGVRPLAPYAQKRQLLMNGLTGAGAFDRRCRRWERGEIAIGREVLNQPRAAVCSAAPVVSRVSRFGEQ